MISDRLIENHVMGWTLWQWAEVAGYCEQRFGWLPLPDIQGAQELMVNWQTARLDAPTGAVTLYLADPSLKPMNFAWATNMMLKVARECPPTWHDRRSGVDRRRATS